MRTLIEMAHEVYGEHTFWTEAQLLRLKELERLVRADERERLKASIALDKMAENARELGLDYETPPVQEKNQSPYPEYDRGFSNGWDRGFAAAQPAPVQDLPFGVGGGLVAIKTLLGRDPCVHANTAIEMIDAMLAAEPQPVPVKTYSGGKPWPVAPKPWVGLSEEEVYEAAHYCVKSGQSVNETIRAIEAKLKEKNT
jgi:signal recognition particle subunit SEC65